jgi:hypothetical protein
VRFIDVPHYPNLSPEARADFDKWLKSEGLLKKWVYRLEVVDESHIRLIRRYPDPTTGGLKDFDIVVRPRSMPPASVLIDTRDDIVGWVRHAIHPEPLHPWQEEVLRQIFSEKPPRALLKYARSR